MKRLLIVLCSFLYVSQAYAQPASYVYRPTPAAIGITPGQPAISTSALVDNFGRVILAPTSNVIVSGASSTATTPTKGTPTTSQPSVVTATSTTCLAANANRLYFLIQNNTAANIMISIRGDALSGIIPSGTNKGIVLVPGATYESKSDYVSTTAITCYQTSGATVETISVVEG